MVNIPSEREPAAATTTRRLFRLLFAVSLLASVAAPLAHAQSGRRKTDPARQSPAPTPTPAAPSEPQGESESQPRGGASKNANIIATFVVYEDDNLELDFAVAGAQRDIVSRTFFDRMRQSSAVEVTAGGKGTRGSARQRAKQERTAYTVHLQLEEDVLTSRDSSRNRDTLGRRDASVYALRVTVYAPTSGELKYNDVIRQRPYRQTARVGGIPVPVPVGRERVPGEYQLAQAARDAADRLLSRFDIARPPDN